MDSERQTLNIIVEDTKHCTPCKTKEKKVESQYYCTDCEAYYCDECFELHPRVPYLAKHIVLKHDDIDVWAKLQYKCTTHNKNLEFFCGDHKELCCHVCVSLQHRSCVGMEYILESAKNICAKDEIKAMIGQTEKELDRIQSYEKKVETKVEANLRSKSEYAEKLEEHSSRLKQMIDLLQNKTLQEMKDVFETNRKYSEEMADELKSFSKELKDIKHQLDSATPEKEVLIFISMKRGEKIIADITQRLSKMDITTDKEIFKPVFDDAVQVYIGNLEKIASLEDEKIRQVSASCEEYTDVQAESTSLPERNLHIQEMDINKGNTQCNIEQVPHHYQIVSEEELMETNETKFVRMEQDSKLFSNNSNYDVMQSSQSKGDKIWNDVNDLDKSSRRKSMKNSGQNVSSYLFGQSQGEERMSQESSRLYYSEKVNFEKSFSQKRMEATHCKAMENKDQSKESETKYMSKHASMPAYPQESSIGYSRKIRCENSKIIQGKAQEELDKFENHDRTRMGERKRNSKKKSFYSFDN